MDLKNDLKAVMIFYIIFLKGGIIIRFINGYGKLVVL